MHAHVKPLFYIIFIGLLAIACSEDKETVTPDPESLDTREAVWEFYQDAYVGSELNDAGWTGDSQACRAGSISKEAQEKTLQRILFFRRMAGLENDISFRPEWNDKCQQAALMMRANSSLNHRPPASWSCFSEAGAEAASKSNLALGASSTHAISLYMNDFGSGNEAVGHRRWILYSQARYMGHGATNSSDVLWVIGGGEEPDTIPEFIAWPPEGFVPADLIYARWSLGIPGANFSDAQVTMKDTDGNELAVNVLPLRNGYGDNTLVWEPNLPNSLKDGDTFTVKVTHVKVSGEVRDFTYQVTVIRAS